MLVSNAINVAADPIPPPETQQNGGHGVAEAIEEVDEKPRTNRWVGKYYRGQSKQSISRHRLATKLKPSFHPFDHFHANF